MARMTERVMVSDPVKRRLVELTDVLSIAKGRDLTYSDAIEELLNHVDGNSWLVKDIAANRRASLLMEKLEARP